MLCVHIYSLKRTREAMYFSKQKFALYVRDSFLLNSQNIFFFLLYWGIWWS